MDILRLSSLETVAALGATHVARVTYADLTDTAGTAKTVTLIASIPANRLFRYVGHVLVTDFDAPSTTMSDMTLAVGYDLSSGTDDADGFQAATSVHADGTEIDATPVVITDVDASAIDTTYGQAELDVLTSLRSKLNSTVKLLPRCFNESWDLEAVFTSTGANLDTLTSGEVLILFALVDLDLVERANKA
jgi:hypothetical protein